MFNKASIVDGYTFIDYHSWDAYNEGVDMQLQIELYQKRFGYLPSTIDADKIYMVTGPGYVCTPVLVARY